MIFGYPIDVHTDHLNWAHDKNVRNRRVLRWRLLLEEYSPTLHYVKGEKNVVADALSRMPFTKDKDESMAMTDEVFARDDTWRRFRQPLTISEMGRAQQQDKYVQQLKRQAPDRLGEWFEDIGKKSGPDRVLTEADATDQQQRIVVPAVLTQRLMEWYHVNLVHPGSGSFT